MELHKGDSFFFLKGKGGGCWWLSLLVPVVYGDYYDQLVVLVDGSEKWHCFLALVSMGRW